MKAKNLEKAARFDYYQFDNLPEHVKTDPYFKEKHSNPEKWEKWVAPDFFNTSNYEVGMFAKVRTQYKNFSNEIELYYIDNFNILLFDDSLDFPLIMKNDWRTKKYHFYPVYELINKLTLKVSYEQQKPFLAEIKEPNKIGVFSDKKIADWVEYCREYVFALEKCNDTITNKKIENQKYIDSVVDSMQGAKIEKHTNYTTIENKLFRIEFALLENGGYLQKKIEFTGSIDDIIKLHSEKK